MAFSYAAFVICRHHSPSVSHNERCLLNDVSTMKRGSARLGQRRKRLVGFCLGHSFRAAKTYCQNCAEDYHHPSPSPFPPLPMCQPEFLRTQKLLLTSINAYVPACA